MELELSRLPYLHRQVLVLMELIKTNTAVKVADSKRQVEPQLLKFAFDKEADKFFTTIGSFAPEEVVIKIPSQDASENPKNKWILSPKLIKWTESKEFEEKAKEFLENIDFKLVDFSAVRLGFVASVTLSAFTSSDEKNV